MSEFKGNLTMLPVYLGLTMTLVGPSEEVFESGMSASRIIQY